ncbi:FAD-binding protein [Amycolatopsis sp. EV170708-02-1]|uniref:FAD-binding protein n=1 Tax=Amycolatopsis sp. EV170708-02-1 TaxID=2919322 RepID=UPI001F0BB0F3|nr:FAD-binding protein [Amycolatopsis sp. EV170708-02-1]UMP05259.1 FAD-binding protein [Amycolatopsis sp. EV170708-02-1]
MRETNWAGNRTYEAERILRPRGLDEVQEAVARADAVKALGSRHCFNDIADCPGGVLLDLSALGTEVVLDPESATVTVPAAARYGDIAVQVHAAGFALANLASLPHCTVAGTVATATHGSGRRNQSLASAVSGLELVTADGEVKTYSGHEGVVVGLGALGVVTRLTLDLVPSFDLRQDVFDGLPWESVYERFDEIQDAGYSVSLFTNWARDEVDQVWVKGPGLPEADFFGAKAADGPRHPAHAAGIPADNCTRQLGVPGPWHERIPHFRLDFTPSIGNELQTEYFVPVRHAVAAMEAMRAIGDRLAPLLLTSEIRTVAGDELWLSPFHGGDRVALHFTWLPDEDAVRALLPVMEDRLAPFEVRPHWGKLFHRAADYPKLADFRALATELDPDGKFRGPFVRRHVFGER